MAKLTINMSEAPPSGGALHSEKAQPLIDLMVLARSMNYSISRLAARLGIRRVNFYNYIHGKQSPREPVVILARQMHAALMEGMRGPLQSCPRTPRDRATEMIDRYLDTVV